MSILSALKTQSNSIDDLAKLPQAMIMQMAQKGQIREDMLAPILARKAELAQAAANVKAMQQQSARPTVMEQILTQNAMQEVPESARDLGVAQLPVREDMYAPQRMAGGGIVAFQDNPDQPVSVDMPSTSLTEEEKRQIEENPYLRRSRGVTEFGRQLGQTFTDPRNYNPVSLYQRYIGEPFARFASESPEAQAQRFRTASQARTGEIPMFAGKDLTTKGKMVAEGRMKPNENVTDVIKREQQQNAQLQKDLQQFDQATALFEKERAAKKGPANVAENVSTSAKTGQTKTQPEAKQETKEEPLYSKYEKMLMDEREAAKGAREEAKYARMLEAGLGILGGSSQYAFENIGKGAAPALRGYGEDIRGLRAEERARVKDLLGIEGMRQEAKRAAEDQALKKEMIRIQEIAARKPSSVAELAALYKTDPELARLVQGEKKAGILTFEEAYKLIAADPKNMALTEAQKSQKARELMTLGSGGGTASALPSGLPPGSVQVGTSQGKPVYKTPDGKLVTVS